MSPLKKILVSVLAAALLSGCAASRSVVDIDVPEPDVTPTKAAVKITGVNDKRHFAVDPPSPLTPSVRDNEIDNKQLVARAVGRKRGGFGNAWGDVVLPEGQTVSGLVAQVLEAALIEKGYAVIPKGGSGYDTALPLSADIIKFWTWVSPGMAIGISHESLVRLTGSWPVKGTSREITGHAHYESYVAIVESDWTDLLVKGTKNLQDNLVAILE